MANSTAPSSVFLTGRNPPLTPSAITNGSPPRFVLVGPNAHEHLGGEFPDPKEHNKNLLRYSQEMQKIAEANMMSTAAGLAVSGKIAFASSFAVFATGRAYDQIRQTISIGKLNVDGETITLGTVVGPDGLVLTKASEIKPGKLTCWLAVEKEGHAQVLQLLRVAAHALLEWKP